MAPIRLSPEEKASSIRIFLTNPTAAREIPQDYLALNEERRSTDYDMRHSAVVSFIWLFNYYNGKGRILRGLLNGWGVSPIMSVHSGIPFTVTSGSDYNLDGISGNDRPNRIRGSRCQSRTRIERLKLEDGSTRRPFATTTAGQTSRAPAD